jgi:hypothetical protein
MKLPEINGALLCARCLALLVALNGVSVALAQGLPTTHERLLQQTRAVFNDPAKRSELTAKVFRRRALQDRSVAWFNSFRGDISTEMYPVERSQLLKREQGKLFSLKRVAEAGDVVYVYSSDLDTEKPVLTLVYMGEEAFPDAPNKKFSFFIYPYRTRLEYNTLPARLHDQCLEGKLASLAYDFGEKDERCGVRWARPMIPHESAFLSTNLFSENLFYDVYRPDDRGTFIGFPPEYLPQMKDAVSRAVSMNRRCVNVLQAPSPDVRLLLKRCFGIADGAKGDAQVAEIRKTFELNEKALKSARFQYAKEDAEVMGYFAATDTKKRMVRISKDVFTTTGLSSFKAVHGDKGLFQTSVVLHEGLHIVNPIEPSEVDVSSGGHWGGLVNYKEAKYREPVPLENTNGNAIAYGDARRNPYCYQFFAIWMSRSTASEALEMFRYLRDDCDYRKVLEGKPISFKDDKQVQGGCEYRAHAMCVALRAKYPAVSLFKVFSVGSTYPKPSIVPYRDGKPVEDLSWGYHVAVAVRVGGTELVLDPTLFSHPVSVQAWLAAQHDPGKVSLITRDAPSGSLGDFAYKPSASSTPGDVRLVTYATFVEGAVK